ncbi:hypothetical protein AK830_g7978 [Neonectria ditissima]|uniref:DUF7708 domain-containing protein n=1 Tax=Neonectria ditissima TaxID=78410 RepID=A0A0P7BDR1_9HYPO|nr:hypothetical protein AK830_g7978 [Neonectria ditissima]
MSSTLVDQQRELFLSSRDRHPPNEAVRYIESNIALPGEPLPVFSERSGGFVTLDEANQQREKSAAIWKEVDAEKEHLFTLMEQVHQKLNSKKGADERTEEEINFRQCNWRVVMEEVQKTAQRWKSRPSKQGKTMVFVDKVGQHSAAWERWLGLLPSGDYGSRYQVSSFPLCSLCSHRRKAFAEVFKLVIRAAGQYSKIEEAIFEALSDIPQIMESARRYVDMYGQMRNQLLEERTVQLFRAVLRLLRHVMQFFVDDKSKKIIGSIVKQDSYKAELFQCVEDVKTRAKAVNDEASHCQGQLLFKVYEQSQEAIKNTQHFYHELMDLFLTSQQCQARDSEPHSLHDATSRLKLSSYDRVNIDSTSLHDENEGTSLQTTPRKTPQSPVQQTDKMTTSVSEDDAAVNRLLRLLNHDQDTLFRGVSRISDEVLNKNTKARAAAMISDDTFQSFMEETQHSTYLLVNGNGGSGASKGIGPLGVIVARLARKAREKAEPGPVFTITHFCNSPFMYSNCRPGLVSGVTTMMAGLIAQLLLQLKDRGIVADLSFLNNSRWQRVEQAELEILLTVFRKLVKQTPPDSLLLCMIDDFVWVLI